MDEEKFTRHTLTKPYILHILRKEESKGYERKE